MTALRVLSKPVRYFCSPTDLITELFLLAAIQGHSLTYLANKSGVCRATLRNWQTGRVTKPHTPTIIAVGKVLGLSLEWVER